MVHSGNRARTVHPLWVVGYGLACHSRRLPGTGPTDSAVDLAPISARCPLPGPSPGYTALSTRAPPQVGASGTSIPLEWTAEYPSSETFCVLPPSTVTCRRHDLLTHPPLPAGIAATVAH
eukprot:4935974-Pyramimonas_sp.AAC.1